MRTQTTVTHTVPLSPMQQGMLYHRLSGGPGDVDLEQFVLTLPEAVDAERRAAEPGLRGDLRPKGS